MSRADAVEAIVVMLGACTLAALLALLLTSCSVGPFYPPSPRACRADPDCPDHSACRYPSASSPGPVCMPGRESDVYGWSPTPGPAGD